MGFTGIAYPFRITGSGGVKVSTTSYESIDHIIEGLAQLLTTHPVERVMESPFGCNLMSVLFSNGDETDLAEAELSIREAVKVYEDRVRIESLTSKFDYSEGIIVDLLLKDITTEEVHSVNLGVSKGGQVSWQTS